MALPHALDSVATPSFRGPAQCPRHTRLWQRDDNSRRNVRNVLVDSDGSLAVKSAVRTAPVSNYISSGVCPQAMMTA